MGLSALSNEVIKKNLHSLTVCAQRHNLRFLVNSVMDNPATKCGAILGYQNNL
jgi:hypothetical protein